MKKTYEPTRSDIETLHNIQVLENEIENGKVYIIQKDFKKIEINQY
jgi:hypothetical protein